MATPAQVKEIIERVMAGESLKKIADEAEARLNEAKAYCGVIVVAAKLLATETTKAKRPRRKKTDVATDPAAAPAESGGTDGEGTGSE